jgi:hypothetical protein
MKTIYQAPVLTSHGCVVAATASGVGMGPEFHTRAGSVGSVGFTL